MGSGVDRAGPMGWGHGWVQLLAWVQGEEHGFRVVPGEGRTGAGEGWYRWQGLDAVVGRGMGGPRVRRWVQL